MRRRRECLAGIAIAIIVLLGLAAPAGAHAQLESTQPDQSSVLTTSPLQVVLHFGEPVEIDFGSIRIIGPKGNRVDEGGTHHPPGNSHAVAISLPPHLPDGTYIVDWRVISADSHPVHGAFIFSVGTATGAGRANVLANSRANAKGDPVVGVTFWLVRFAAFTSLVLLVGVATVVTSIWPVGGQTRRIGRLLWVSWAVLLFCSVAGVAVQGVYASSLPLTDVVRPTLFNEVLHTRFGEVEALRVVLLIAVVPILLVIRGRAVARGATRLVWIVLGAGAGVGLLLTPGLAGHASTGSNPILGIALDLLHLAGVSVWLGGLAVLGALLLPGLPDESRPGDIGSLAMKFSAYAFAAVIVVVVTGVIQSIREVGSFYALFNTTYGVTLSIKVGFVITLIALGTVSRRLVLGGWVGPRIRGRIRSSRPGLGARAAAVATHSPDASGRNHLDGLRRSVCAEIAIALVVLGVTALLVNATPAKQAANQPFSQSFNVLGVQINAIVAPAKTGPGNQVHFYVLGRQGQSVAIPELDAAISLPSAGIGPLPIPLVVASPGHFRANDFTIPRAGDWRLKLTVRTSPIDEQELFATVPIH